MEEPNPTRKLKPTKESNNNYEFCKVCKLNQNQGPRHKYLPKHRSSLSTFLSRFHNKINDIRFFLKNPTLLRHELAHRNRFWCVVCDVDVDELDSTFACENAINHLVGVNHLKNLKHFLWQYGGKMDCLDSYRILETDLTKWEKKCKSLKAEAEAEAEAEAVAVAVAAASEGSCTVVYGNSNDIHNNINLEKANNIEQNLINTLESSYPNVVMPLQYNTNKYQISNSGFAEVAKVGSNLHEVNLPLSTGASSGTSLWTPNNSTINSNRQQKFLYNNLVSTGNAYLSNIGVDQMNQAGIMSNGGSSSLGLQRLTQVSVSTVEVGGGNVHSGAPPPWFEATDLPLLNDQVNPALSDSISSNNSKKSHKLNPKRVGAAWAEKRKLELEKEKRGEVVNSDFDANWLPNFGRVWQSGSRKESRKEFEIEKQKFLNDESHSEMPIKIQPYVSKRMRQDCSE